MADLGAIGFCHPLCDRQPTVKGGTISGAVVGAAGGASVIDRVVTTLDRTLYPEGAIPVFGRTVVHDDGTYAFAVLDASFSSGPHKYLVLCLEDATGYPALVHDKVTPV